MTARRAGRAPALALALVLATTTGCVSTLRFPEEPARSPADVGEVGLPSRSLSARVATPDAVEVPFPGGIVRVVTAGPTAGLVPAADDLDRRLRPVDEGAEVRDVAWSVTPSWDLTTVLGQVDVADLAVRAGDVIIPLRSPIPGVDWIGSGSAGLVVPAGARLSLELAFPGGAVSVALDGPDRGDAGPAEGLRDGLTVREGGCRVLDVEATTEPGPPPVRGPRLEAGVVDSSWWPGLGFAEAGRSWRAVRVSGVLDRLDPADVVDTAPLALAGGRRVRDTAEDAPFGRYFLGTSAVFDVPAGGRTADLTVTAADGDVVVTCRPVAVTPPPR